MLPAIIYGQGLTVLFAWVVSWVGEVQRCWRCKNEGTGLHLSWPRTCARSHSSSDHHFPGLYGAGESARNTLEMSLSSRAPKDLEGIVKVLGWPADGPARPSLLSGTLFSGGGVEWGGWHRGTVCEESRSTSLHLGSLKWLHTQYIGFRAHLPREEYFNIWPGRTPSVCQVCVGRSWGQAGERQGGREGSCHCITEHFSGRWVLG